MADRTCAWCQHSLAHRPRSYRATTCSRLCSQRKYRDPGHTLATWVARPCAACGGPLGDVPRNTKTCSSQCRHWMKTHPGERLTRQRKCAACAADISHTNMNATCCSPRCATWLRRHPGETWTAVEGRPCEHCGSSVSGKRLDARYCTRECKNRAKQQLYRAEKRYPLAEWHRRNPGMKNEYAQRQRARKAGNPGYVAVTKAEWTKIRNRFGWRCAYCDLRTSDLTQDHVVPLIRGGRHAPANIVPACRLCNSRKSSRFLIEWKLERRRYAVDPVRAR